MQIGGPGTAGYNRYAHGVSNPVSFTDPSGHMALSMLADPVTTETVAATQVARTAQMIVMLAKLKYLAYRARWLIAVASAAATAGGGVLLLDEPSPSTPADPKTETEPAAPSPSPKVTTRTTQDGPVQVFRALDGSKNTSGWTKATLSPSQFSLRPGEPGLSTFELLSIVFPTEKPFVYPFLIRAPYGARIPGVTGEVEGLQLWGCFGTYTPQYGDLHWDIRCADPASMGTNIAGFAKVAAFAAVPNPRYTGLTPYAGG